MTGFLLIDKPETWTSHDVVGYLRKITKIKKIGHAGTLDPFATGLLIVGIGRDATKRLDEFKCMPKTYEAEIILGATSDTFDKDGTITKNFSNLSNFSTREIDDVLQKFKGKQKQLPPMFSAKKVKGKKLYELARKGIEIERKPNDIEIYNIERIRHPEPFGFAQGRLKQRIPLLQKLLSFGVKNVDTKSLKQRDPSTSLRSAQDDSFSFHIRVSCSTGTYIRTLIHDIGKELGCGAYCKELRRTQIGSYRVTKAKEPKQLSKKRIKRRLIHT